MKPKNKKFLPYLIPIALSVFSVCNIMFIDNGEAEKAAKQLKDFLERNILTFNEVMLSILGIILLTVFLVKYYDSTKAPIDDSEEHDEPDEDSQKAS